jgi:hypothetical protein
MKESEKTKCDWLKLTGMTGKDINGIFKEFLKVFRHLQILYFGSGFH